MHAWFLSTESLESHTVRFTAWIIGYGIPRRLRLLRNTRFQSALSILACCHTYCSPHECLTLSSAVHLAAKFRQIPAVHGRLGVAVTYDGGKLFPLGTFNAKESRSVKIVIINLLFELIPNILTST
jgi:hypothetical protein